ncbi:MAG: hypothetical protein PHP65_01475 [Bacilli bacterium]|nr:hypothetical protein [Bacilli bacterium]
MTVTDDEQRMLERMKGAIVQSVKSLGGIKLLCKDNKLRRITFGPAWRIFVNYKIDVTSLDAYNLPYIEKMMIDKKVSSINFSKRTSDLVVKLCGKIEIHFLHMKDDAFPWGVDEL